MDFNRFDALSTFALAKLGEKVMPAFFALIFLYALTAQVAPAKCFGWFKDSSKCTKAVLCEIPLFVIAVAHDTALVYVLLSIAFGQVDSYAWACEWLKALSIGWVLSAALMYIPYFCGVDLKVHKHSFKFVFSICCLVLDFDALIDFKILYCAVVPGILRKLLWLLEASRWRDSTFTCVWRRAYHLSFLSCQIATPLWVLGSISIANDEDPVRRSLACLLLIPVSYQCGSETGKKAWDTLFGKFFRFLQADAGGAATAITTDPESLLQVSAARNHYSAHHPQRR